MTTNPTPIQHSRYLRVALRSALAAALFLGFPAGLLLWLALFHETAQTAVVDLFVNILQTNGVNKIILLTVCLFGWSYLLAQTLSRLWQATRRCYLSIPCAG